MQGRNYYSCYMLSKSQISLLKSLQQKKFRIEHGYFLVEGIKSVNEFINSAYQIEAIYHTLAFDPNLLKLSRNINFNEISLNDLEKISTLKKELHMFLVIGVGALIGWLAAKAHSNYTNPPPPPPAQK